MAWTEHYVTSGGTDTYANSTNSSTPCSLATAIAGCAAGDRINIKAGTYAYGASVPFTTAGSATAPIWWRGYKTTPGDLDSAGGSRIPATDMPLISLANTGHQITSAGGYQIFSNIAVTSICTTTGGAWSSSGTQNRFIRCQIDNTQATAGARAIATGAATTLVGCRLKSTTTATSTVNVSVGCTMHGCTIIGGAVGLSVSDHFAGSYNVVYGYATSGVSLATAGRNYSIVNFTIYSAATNGILIAAAITGWCIIANTIIGGCTNGINNNTGSNLNSATLVSNQFYACTNNIVGLTEQADVTSDLAASTFNIDNDTDPWVAKASADYSLASGVAARSAAYPGVFDDPSGTNVMTGYPDIGAVRHADPAAGGGETSHTFIS